MNGELERWAKWGARAKRRDRSRGKAPQLYGLAKLRTADVTFFKSLPIEEQGPCWKYELHRQIAARYTAGLFSGGRQKGDPLCPLLPKRAAVSEAWRRDYALPWANLTAKRRTALVQDFSREFTSFAGEMKIALTESPEYVQWLGISIRNEDARKAAIAKIPETLDAARREKARIESIRSVKKRALPWNFPGVMADPDPALPGELVVFKLDWSLSKAALTKQFANALDCLGAERKRTPNWQDHLRAIAAQRLIDNCPPWRKPWELAEEFLERDLTTEQGIRKAARRYRAMEAKYVIELTHSGELPDPTLPHNEPHPFPPEISIRLNAECQTRRETVI